MTQKARQSKSSSKAAVHPVVLFGVDRHGKPTAARFPEGEARLAAKAAERLQLRVLTVTTPAVAELAATLPVGRIHASGKGFVPNVRADLYAKLLAMADPPAQVTQPAVQAPGRAQSNGEAAKTKKSAPDCLPSDWDAIAPGQLVVAQESLEDGWYEAIVLEQNGDMFTLRWRDYPRERRFARHRRALALLCPNPNDVSVPAPQKAAKAAAKTGAARPSAQALPQTWAQIDNGSVVLAQQDGPHPAWWEAIPTENNGPTLTLRWRDYGKLPTVERARVSLALLCPPPLEG
jgi:hypothetical protein